ncbi:MAG: hypothetical protein ACYTXC_10070 [Nostoc sp.]
MTHSFWCIVEPKACDVYDRLCLRVSADNLVKSCFEVRSLFPLDIC